MSEYPKINSLWKREGLYFDKEKAERDGKHRLNSFREGDYAQPEFGAIKHWSVEEKIDGTNIRIYWERGERGKMKVSFQGRTKDADIPKHLMEYLEARFSSDFMDMVLDAKESSSGCLYGEGYGPKIQAAGTNYRRDAGFILFDVRIGHWWLKRDDMRDIGMKLKIPCVPDLGIMTEEEVVVFVKSKPLSRCSMNPMMMEGVVCRSEPLMLTRRGLPIMWKLKTKEFN